MTLTSIGLSSNSLGCERDTYGMIGARRNGLQSITSIDELRAEVFESDEELDEFLADLYAFRHQNLV